MTHLAPGDAVAFDSTVRVEYAPEVVGSATQITGFAPLDTEGRGKHFQTTTGGVVKLALRRSSAILTPVELTDSSLNGEIHSNGKSVGFRFTSTAVVTEANAEIVVLSGNAAVSEVPTDAGYRLRLSSGNDHPVYRLVFPKVGTYPVTLDFVAAVLAPEADDRSMDFNVAASTVVPLTLNGLEEDLEFHWDQVSIVPIRHSRFLRMTNLGSVRLKSIGLSGLTQLAPEQFPGDATKARQVFVYRFPAADHEFTIAADRIQPEVNVSEVILYQLAEADRVIKADVELDIRKAPIREWDFGIPEDYSVVAVAGPTDYILGSDVADGRRNLKVMFGQDVVGRQLVTLYLEKSEAAAAGDWTRPRIEYPKAKSVRGEIGVIGVAVFRIAVAETDLMVDKSLSYCPNPTPGMQQAFRIREPG